MALSTYQDFFQLTVKQLKRYLAVRGLNQDGRHAELVARPFVAMEMKMTSKSLLVEIIKFDINHWSRVETNLELFYKCYVCPAILFITPITFCAKCDKPVFQEKELLPKEQNTLSKVQCADCCCWYHKQCTGVHFNNKKD